MVAGDFTSESVGHVQFIPGKPLTYYIGYRTLTARQLYVRFLRKSRGLGVGVKITQYFYCPLCVCSTTPANNQVNDTITLVYPYYTVILIYFDVNRALQQCIIVIYRRVYLSNIKAIEKYTQKESLTGSCRFH